MFFRNIIIIYIKYCIEPLTFLHFIGFVPTPIEGYLFCKPKQVHEPISHVYQNVCTQ